MGDRLDSLEARLQVLEARFEEFARRLDAAPGPPAAATPTGPVAAAEESIPITRGLEQELDRHDLVLLAGLVSLVLAGAMALRIVAMSDVLSLAAGGALGVAYCAALLGVAQWKFRAGPSLHGDTFAVLAVVILDALLVELAHRKGGFPRPAAYAVLAVSLLALATTTLLKSRGVPFAVALLAAPVTGAAIGGTPFLHPHFAAILSLAVVAGQVGMWRRRWSWARWGPAAFCVLYILLLSLLSRSTARTGLDTHAFARPVFALPIIGAFFALYVLPAAAAALIRARPLDRFEVTLAVGMAVVTFAGVANVLLALPTGAVIAGVTGLAVSALFYGSAVASFVRHGAESTAFYALSAIAAIYAFSGLAPLVPSGPLLGAAWMAFGFSLSWFAARLGKRTLAIHSIVVTLLAAAITLLGSVDLSPPSGDLGDRSRDGLGLLLAGALAVATFERLRAFRRDGEVLSSRRARFRRAMQALTLACGVLLVLCGALPVAASLVLPLFGGTEIAGLARALWFTLQTQLTILGALAVLAAGVRLRMDGAVLLAVLLMAVGGLKLFAFDAMKVPALCFIVAAITLGGALILSSFLYRRYRGLRGPGSSGGPGTPFGAAV